MAYSPIHPLLAHLSETQLAELIRRYYGRERIKDLLGFYKINCLPHRLFSLLPLEICHDECPNCGGMMIVGRIPRYRLRFEKANGTACTHCFHKTGQQCYCGYCQQQRTAKVKVSKPDAINVIPPVGANTFTIQAEKMSLQQVVSVLALAKSFSAYGFDRTFELNSSDMPFAPMGQYGDRLIEGLVNAGLVKVAMDRNQPGRPVFSGNSGLPNPYLIQWNITEQELQRLIYTTAHLVDTDSWPSHWHGELSNVVFDLALAECSEFYDWCARERQFPAADEQKKFGLIYGLLKDFSVGFSCRAINSAAQYAADYMVTKSATPQQAANYMLLSCQRWVDKARVEQWQVKPFRRNINCPRSMISLVLYETFLNIPDDAAFNMPLADIAPQPHELDLS